jgi:hypothetical protein
VVAAVTHFHLPVIASTPPTRADCTGALWPRPCPVESCRYFLPRVQARRRHRWRDRDVSPQHSDSCSLDAIQVNGAMSLGEVGHRFGVSRERIRQIERDAFQKARRACERLQIDFTTLVASWDTRSRG